MKVLIIVGINTFLIHSLFFKRKVLLFIIIFRSQLMKNRSTDNLSSKGWIILLQIWILNKDKIFIFSIIYFEMFFVGLFKKMNKEKFQWCWILSENGRKISTVWSSHWQSCKSPNGVQASMWKELGLSPKNTEMDVAWFVEANQTSTRKMFERLDRLACVCALREPYERVKPGNLRSSQTSHLNI